MCILACPLVCIELQVLAIVYSYRENCTCTFPAGISCGPATDAPANGQRSGSGTTFESTVTYTCSQGYALQGDNSRTCMANGQWNGRAPTCDRKLLCEHYVCSTIDIYGHWQVGICTHYPVLGISDKWQQSVQIPICLQSAQSRLDC